MKTMLGPSAQIDPAFAYYQNRSEQSIADELEVNGYRVVHYFVTNETQVNEKLLDRLLAKGMFVWAMVLGNGTYTTDHLPLDWPDWQMVLLKRVKDGYFRLSPFSYRYVGWKKQALAELVRTYPFDGLEVAEPYLPEWNGLSSGVYGDLGPYARAAFKQRYGSEIPDFRHWGAPNYYKRNPILYRQWVEFRVEAVNRFLFELVNGPGGVREARPGIKIATWSLGVDAGPDSVQKLKEYQGLDAVSMISTVRPDMHFIQTHWPDWMRGRLPTDYAKRYEPFVSPIRALYPELPLGLQTDIGSLLRMRRSRAWLEEFAKLSPRLGYSTWTAYEYHAGKYMYDEVPVPLKAVRLDSRRVRLQFQKRIDADQVRSEGKFYLWADGVQTVIPEPIRVLEVDGGSVLLDCVGFPAGRFQLALGAIRDTPELWLFPQKRANELTLPYVVTVDEAHTGAGRR